ncbi:MAG TPA: PTS sugar transporter subunit IIA [Phycisphaerae bacterium]|nr:PTS sugar transporter subunit IIA [Phycisphaerales bacterium]HRX86673.1 PTS sugar transporter subunit IIA [Phycisphaerae bacterium]
MPYQNMTLEEFAKHVGLDARDVKKMAERDKIPAQKVLGKWRFNRAEVTEWLQQDMLNLDINETRLRAIEQAMSEAGTRDIDQHLVTALMSLNGIDLNLQARTKSSVLLELAGLADRTGLLWDQPGLLTALQARESLCCTALPKGIAIPHPRQPMPYVSSEPFICFARLSKGIGYGSPFGDLTDLFFLICCHEDRHHLHVLARMMRILTDDVIHGLRNAETAEQALALLIEREEVVAKQAIK